MHYCLLILLRLFLLPFTLLSLALKLFPLLLLHSCYLLIWMLQLLLPLHLLVLRVFLNISLNLARGWSDYWFGRGEEIKNTQEELGAKEVKVVQVLQEQNEGERHLPIDIKIGRRFEGWRLEKGKWKKRKYRNLKKSIKTKDENKEILTTEQEAQKPYIIHAVMDLLVFVYISVIVCI